MKFSVLIPAFQAGHFIDRALESVRAQTNSDWEAIIVEDGSHDRTRECVEQFTRSGLQLVRYENLHENRGVATARNRLLELASGEAFAFLDADDRWETSHLANAAALIHNGAELVVSGVSTFDLAQNRALENFSPPPALIRNPVLTLFLESCIVTSSAVVLTRDLAMRTGRFDPAFRIGEDRDYWLRAALAGGRFATTGEFTCSYAKHASSSMAHTRVVAEQTVRFYEKYRTLATVPSRQRRRLFAESLICLGRLMREQDKHKSAACFWRAWQSEPFNPRILFHLVFTGWRSVTPARAT